MKDNRILAEINLLSRSIQSGTVPGSGIRVYYTARIIEWLSEILMWHETATVHAFLKWLDTDNERRYYNDNLFAALGIEL